MNTDTEKYVESWQVAASVLIEEGEMHIDSLTNCVVDTGLSTLGFRCTTPRQTLSPLINTKKSEWFRRTLRGYYEIKDRDDALANSGMAEAHRRYCDWRSERDRQRSKRDELEALRQEIAALRARNRDLRAVLDNISSLCTDA